MDARNIRPGGRTAPSPRRKAPSSGAHAQNRAPRAPRAARLEKQKKIVLAAEQQFANFGFEGVSLDDIAAALGISRQNMLYYFANKEALYLAVLDDVLESWIGSMDLLTRKNDPETAIRAYIRAKLQFSRERPSGSAVFTREVMVGAPRYGKQLAARVNPKLRADIRAFERWARQGLIERLNFTHLMFFIWSVTQSYADLGPQFALLIGKRQLGENDFAAAQDLLCQLVLNSLRPQAQAGG